MMYFGWRPLPSCYTQDGKNIPLQSPLAQCQSPSWWYWLLAASAAAGLLVRSKKK